MEDPAAVGPPDGDVGMGLGVGEIELDMSAHEVVEHDDFPMRAEPPCAAAFVEEAAVLELVEIAQVDFLSFALEIRAAVAALERAFVPVEPEPFQTVVDGLGRLGGIAGFVGVFDAQDERAAGVPGVEPVEKRGAGATDVKIAGGRGGEADTDVGTHRNSQLCTTCRGISLHFTRFFSRSSGPGYRSNWHAWLSVGAYPASAARSQKSARRR